MGRKPSNIQYVEPDILTRENRYRGKAISLFRFQKEFSNHKNKFNTKIPMVRKRTDTARKIYDIFKAIGEDKILRIKSFTASSFSDLTEVRSHIS